MKGTASLDAEGQQNRRLKHLRHRRPARRASPAILALACIMLLVATGFTSVAGQIVPVPPAPPIPTAPNPSPAIPPLPDPPASPPILLPWVPTPENPASDLPLPADTLCTNAQMPTAACTCPLDSETALPCGEYAQDGPECVVPASQMAATCPPVAEPVPHQEFHREFSPDYWTATTPDPMTQNQHVPLLSGANVTSGLYRVTYLRGATDETGDDDWTVQEPDLCPPGFESPGEPNCRIGDGDVRTSRAASQNNLARRQCEASNSSLPPEARCNHLSPADHLDGNCDPIGLPRGTFLSDGVCRIYKLPGSRSIFASESLAVDGSDSHTGVFEWPGGPMYIIEYDGSASKDIDGTPGPTWEVCRIRASQPETTCERPPYFPEAVNTPFLGAKPTPLCGCAASSGKGGSVQVANGELVYSTNPAEVAGLQPAFSFEMIYRSLSPDATSSDGLFGPGWDYAYSGRLVEQEDGAVRRFGDGRADTYDYNAGDASYISPPGFYDRLTKVNATTFVIRERYGTERTFQRQDSLWPYAGSNDTFLLTRIKAPTGDTTRIWPGHAVLDPQNRLFYFDQSGIWQFVALRLNDTQDRVTNYTVAFDWQSGNWQVSDHAGNVLAGLTGYPGPHNVVHTWGYEASTGRDPHNADNLTYQLDSGFLSLAQLDGQFYFLNVTGSHAIVDLSESRAVYFEPRVLLNLTSVLGARGADLMMVGADIKLQDSTLESVESSLVAWNATVRLEQASVISTNSTNSLVTTTIQADGTNLTIASGSFSMWNSTFGLENSTIAFANATTSFVQSTIIARESNLTIARGSVGFWNTTLVLVNSTLSIINATSLELDLTIELRGNSTVTRTNVTETMDLVRLDSPSPEPRPDSSVTRDGPPSDTLDNWPNCIIRPSRECLPDYNQNWTIELRQLASFEYDSLDRLSVANATDSGRTSFTYDAQGNLAQVRDGNNALVIQVTFDPYGRVHQQVYGAGTYKFQYNAVEHVTRVTDPNGNVVDYWYESLARPLVVRRETFTNRDINPSEPASYVTRYAYNRHGERTMVRHPRGNLDEFTWDDANTNVLSQGNLLSGIKDPGPLAADGIGDDSFPRMTRYTYDPVFNQLLTETDARAYWPNFVPPNGGIASEQRYQTRYFYEFMESASGDLNGDGITHRNVPNLIRKEAPVANPFGSPHNGFSEGYASQARIETWQHNGHGQITRHVDTVGTATTWTYFASNGRSGVTASYNPGTTPWAGSPAALKIPVAVPAARFDPSDGEAYVSSNVRDAGGFNQTLSYERDFDGMPSAIADGHGMSVSLAFARCNLMNATASPETSVGVDVQPDGNGRPAVVLRERPSPMQLWQELNDTKDPFVTFKPMQPLNISYPTEPWVWTEKTTYNSLGKTLVSTLNASRAPESPSTDEDQEPATGHCYDMKGNLILERRPMSMNSAQIWDLTATVYDERDLPVLTVRGDIPEIYYNQPREGGDHCSIEPECTEAGTEEPVECPSRPHGSPYSAVARAYDANGNLAAEIDPLGRVTRFEYDGYDQLVRTVQPNGNRVERRYDPVGNVIHEQTVGGRTVYHGVCPGNDIPAVGGLVATAQCQLAGSREEAERVDQVFAEVYRFHDEANRAYRTDTLFKDLTTDQVLQDGPLEPGDGYVTSLTEFDRASRTIRTINDNGHVASTAYDALGRVNRTVDAGGNVLWSEYDRNGKVAAQTQWVVSTIDGLVAKRYRTATETDAQKGVILRTNGLDEKFISHENSRGGQSHTTSAEGKEVRRVIDASGRAVCDCYVKSHYSTWHNETDSVTIASMSPYSIEGLDDGLTNLTFHGSLSMDLNGEWMSLETNASTSFLLEGPYSIESNDVHEIQSFLAGYLRLANGTIVLLNFTMILDYPYSSFPPPDEYNDTPRFVPWTPPTNSYNETSGNMTLTDGIALFNGTSMIPAVGNITIKDGVANALVKIGVHTMASGNKRIVVERDHVDCLEVVYEFDGDGRLVEMRDGLGQATKYTYDALGRQVQETFADGTFVQMTYDAAGNVVTVRDANGNVVNNTYDEMNRLVRVNVTPGPGVVGTTSQVFVYDAVGHRLVAWDNSTDLNVQTIYTYDSMGRATTETTMGQTVSSRYDGLGNRVQMRYPTGRVLNFTYNAMGLLDEVWDDGLATGLDAVLPIERVSDSRIARLVARYDYVGSSVESRLLGNGIRTDWTRDDASRLVELEHRANASGTLVVGFAYGYDRDGQKVREQKLHAESQSESYAIDFMGRLNRFDRGVLSGGIAVADAQTAGAYAAEWILDDANNWQAKSRQDASGWSTETRDHDVMNAITNRTIGSTTTGVDYDANGNIVDDGTRLFKWDFKNRLRQVTTPTGALLAKYDYDAENRRVRIQGADLDVKDLVMDGSNVVQETDPCTGLALRQFIHGPGVDEHLAMDDVLAPWLSQLKNNCEDYGVILPPECLDDAPPELDCEALVPCDVLMLGVDCNGCKFRLLAGAAPVVGYGKAELTCGVCLNLDGVTPVADPSCLVCASFFTDTFSAGPADHVAVSGVRCNPCGPTAGVFTILLVGGAHMIPACVPCQPTENAAVVVSSWEFPLVFTEGMERDFERCGTIDYRDRLYFLQNEQQSVFALTNATGVIVEAYQYDPFGHAITWTPGPDGLVTFGGDDVVLESMTLVLSPYLYTGREFDADSGLMHYRTRYLDVELGRFISRDTIGVWGDAASLGNGYAYAGNSPFMFTDPMGTCQWWNVVCHGARAAVQAFGAVGKMVWDCLGWAGLVGLGLGALITILTGGTASALVLGLFIDLGMEMLMCIIQKTAPESPIALIVMAALVVINPEKFLVKPKNVDNVAKEVGTATRTVDKVDDAAGTAKSCMVNSFTAQTMVLMADGTWQPIELIQEGDYVWAFDPVSGERGPREVVGLIQGTGMKDLVTFTVNGDNLTTTSGHPFWVMGRGWVDAGDVNVGDSFLQGDGGVAVVEAVQKSQLVSTVYNFEVQDLHTYFVEVDGEGVLVHNCLVTPQARNHILHGDETGGGHLWPGKPGKSPFPQNWDESKVMRSIEDVVQRPSDKFPDGAEWIYLGTREGIEIRVVVRDGYLVTGYPTNVPRNA